MSVQQAMKWAFNQFPVLKSSQTQAKQPNNHPTVVRQLLILLAVIVVGFN